MSCACASPLPIPSSNLPLRPVLNELLRPKQVTPPLVKAHLPINPVSSPRTRTDKENRDVASRKRKPAKLVIPDDAKLASFSKLTQFQSGNNNELDNSQIHSYEHACFGIASKRGRKNTNEDAYSAIPAFQGKPDQAFFGVFDGHGGRDAAKFAAENLGGNVAVAMENHQSVENAVRAAYMDTDAQFLDKHVSSGACSISALIHEGHLLVASAGDCKAVLSRNGKAEPLNTVHRLNNQEERRRVEDLGGYVDCFNGTWRLQGTLAVSRGFGDRNLKKWVSSEPQLNKLKITQECEFLIIASDGLWDRVNDQEAIDCVRRILFDSNVVCQTPNPTTKGNMLEGNVSKIDACNMLIQKACSRGNLDDITVMVVLMKGFSTP